MNFSFTFDYKNSWKWKILTGIRTHPPQYFTVECYLKWSGVTMVSRINFPFIFLEVSYIYIYIYIYTLPRKMSLSYLDISGSEVPVVN